MSNPDTIKQELLTMADDRGEITYTSNTRDILDKAVAEGWARPVSGKFKMLQDGVLSSVYRVTI